MAKHKVIVWASVAGRTATEVVSIESNTTPTVSEINEIYESHIANILDSGADLIIEDEDSE